MLLLCATDTRNPALKNVFRSYKIKMDSKLCELITLMNIIITMTKDFQQLRLEYIKHKTSQPPTNNKAQLAA